MTPTSVYFTNGLIVIISQYFCVQNLETLISSHTAFHPQGLYGLPRYMTGNEVKEAYFQSIKTVK